MAMSPTLQTLVDDPETGMKAVQGLTRTTDLGLKGDMYKISKAMKMDDGEMAACFMKLKEIVPTVPDDKKISKMQLLQHVIDYIFDLEIALDVPSSGMSGNLRTPLSERVEPSNIQDEVCDFMEEDCIARSTAK